MTKNIYRAYLNAMLKLGFVNHVYCMIDHWGGFKSFKILGSRITIVAINQLKDAAIWEASEALINQHDFHRCPSCEWATKKKREHIALGSYCYESEAARLKCH